MKKEIVVLSLGGSIIIPDEIDLVFLRKFRQLILQNLRNYAKIIIVAGGGKVCRKYQQAAKKLTTISQADLDWIGIAATKLNSELIRTLFAPQAFSSIVDQPRKKIKTPKKIIVGSGSLPGSSSDLDAVLLAENFGAKTVINLSNISYVYTKDPRKYQDAKPIKKISWQEFKKVIGTKYKPGMNVPFDPVAAKRAEKKGIKVIIAKGTNLNNFSNLLKEKPFQGTVIG